MPPFFLITIDVEGDNVWARPRTTETKNAAFLPAFQALCERFGLRPTYLTNFEMASSPAFREFAGDVLRRNAGEIGMHLHAWDTPPLEGLTADDASVQPYAIDYPEAVLRGKVRFMTDLLETTFERKMVSHRSGRWALDGTYARALVDYGYLVDCSVTPHVSWRHVPGAPSGAGGSDYSRAPEEPYFLDLADVSRRGRSPLLEVPTTVVLNGSAMAGAARAAGDVFGRFAARAVNRVAPRALWLRPNGRNRRTMLDILRRKQAEGAAHVEFMLHSSELMPGGSPTFRTERSVSRLYEDMSAVFAAASGCTPATLNEFRSKYQERSLVT